MKKLWKQKEKVAFGVIIIFIAVVSVVSILSINLLQGNARVVNYAGIIRGGTQKLIKEEIMGWHYQQEDALFAENSEWYPDDALLEKLDVIVNELLTGDGPNGLIVLRDQVYLDGMRSVAESWEGLKSDIYEVREGANPSDLFVSSQEYFGLVNDAVFLRKSFLRVR